ncbi:MAG TPA: hypothetical protein VLQ91_10075 [Draconibacterium sp.]|nr:hypothetical protein [Draconibacterium sp.]
MVKLYIRLLFFILIIPLIFILFESCTGKRSGEKESTFIEKLDAVIVGETPDEYNPVNAMLVLPQNPAPGESFRILATGGRNIRKAKIIVNGLSGNIEMQSSKTGEELPCWRIDDFAGITAGNYTATLILDKKEVSSFEFEIAPQEETASKGVVWKTRRGWDSSTETLYSVWVNALFQGSDEQSSWPALHEVTRSRDRNFLYNYLSLGEDDPENKNKVIMEPDCADNPFFLRAYFAWKLGLPFGFHICDRGYLGRNPKTGQWITNETSTSKSNSVLAFNSFVRRIMDGVHSGTARTALDNENSDYYPVSLERATLWPGTVFADPYGHTLILVSWIPQTKGRPGLLFAVDAQPDNTIAIKRFWKGNFLFNTSEVVGEPGFKAFRPILFENGKAILMKNEELTTSTGFAPFSLQQRNMESEVFYHTMERIINPKPLDPEAALTDLIQALHEQLLVRVKSVANGEAYLKLHPGTVIPMPSNANGIFQTGGLWEDFSTPNRDLRLLIAMDAVLNFPDRVASSPEDFDISKRSSPEEIKNQLQSFLDKQVSELTVSYTRTDGSLQELTVAEILKRRDAFEMAYNPNDCIEIRWGAPENSDERSTCKRKSPANQQKTMQSVRKWFSSRLHPPT